MPKKKIKGWIEHRKYDRVQQRLQVHYVPLRDRDAVTLLDHDTYRRPLPRLRTRVRDTFTEDISAGGMALLSDKPLKALSYLLVDFLIPRTRKPIRAIAMVSRYIGEETSEGKTAHRYGIQLAAIHKEDFEKLQKFTRSLQA